MLPLSFSSPLEYAAEQRTQFAAAYSVLESGISEHVFPGAAFGVLFRGKLVALDGLGHLTYPQGSVEDVYGEAAPPQVTNSTIFDLASVTKVVATTSAAMLLYDRGLLDLDEPLGNILPGFVVGMKPGSGKTLVTIRMLLSHSSGLPAYAKLYESHSTPLQMLRACLRLPLEARPETRAEYSDIGFILLGIALEVLSGEKLAHLCARDIFEPLGMTRTRFCPPDAWRHEIPPTERDTTFRHRVIRGEVHDENCFALGGAAGHAGVFSPAGDVLKFAECILAGGRTPPKVTQQGSTPHADTASRLFKQETVELFAARQDIPPGSSRALGWDTPSNPSSSGSRFSKKSIGHLGYTGTSLWLDRERELAVVLLTNRTWPTRDQAGRSSDAIRRIRPLFHDAVFCAL